MMLLSTRKRLFVFQCIEISMMLALLSENTSFFTNEKPLDADCYQC